MSDRNLKSSISTSPEEFGSRRRASAGGGRRRGGAGGDGGSSRLLGNTVLVVLMAGLMVAGWFIAEQYQRLQGEAAALADAKARLEVLEDRLRVTDEALTETGATTSEQINFWESEIRKLWAVTNERNRKWIEDNQKAIAALQQSTSGLDATMRDIRGTLGRHESAFSRQQEVVDQLTAMEVQLQQIVRSQRDLVDRVNAASQSVASLNSGLANRVKETEEAVAAIDAYRLQLNSRLADLERRLNSLTGSASL
jgi:DNA repair exonuclease SbcCD ATPase subunit